MTALAAPCSTPAAESTSWKPAYKRGAKEVLFDREEIVDAAQKLGLPRPKNVLFRNPSKRLRQKVWSGYYEKLAQAVTVLCSERNGW